METSSYLDEVREEARRNGYKEGYETIQKGVSSGRGGLFDLRSMPPTLDDARRALDG
jgi:hypothetical protein